MPSRKSLPSSDSAVPDTRRSSLRRLSSIASLQTLNPFNRRRSNNLTNLPSATASDASLSGTLANPPPGQPDLITRYLTSGNTGSEDDLPPLPAQPHNSARRSSYICLPDDPVGGMPRSRTFSNLPLPTRAKRSANSFTQSKSHARLPSASSTQPLPATRLPTPTWSTRKHSVSHLPIHESRAASTKKRLVRSDTEPLLQNALSGSAVSKESVLPPPRSTAFKENISLSPIKPLSRLDDIDFFASPSRIHSGGEEDSDYSGELQSGHLPTRLSSLAYSTRAQHGGPNTRRLSQKFESSPAYRSSKDRAPTPGKPVQRWNSQPLLTNSTNLRSSHGEIKQARLMSARYPPTPPPPKTPTGSLLADVNHGRPRTGSSRQPLQPSDQAARDLNERVQRIRARAESLQRKPGAIFEAQPIAYWTGRFSSLNDRYRNEELAASDLPSNATLISRGEGKWHAKADTDRMHSSEANSLRMRRAVEHLHSLCATDEAMASFLVWQKAIARSLGMSGLAKPVKGSDGRVCALEMSLKEKARCEDATENPPSSERRKMSFMERLLGKRQKSVGMLSSVGITY